MPPCPDRLTRPDPADAIPRRTPHRRPPRPHPDPLARGPARRHRRGLRGPGRDPASAGCGRRLEGRPGRGGAGTLRRPLPASGLVASGASFTGPGTRLRGVEAEVAFRVGRDLGADLPADPTEAFDAVLPVIEVCESRFADFPGSDPLAQLADFQTHGALVLGAPSPMTAEALDLRRVELVLTFDDRTVATTRGTRAPDDLWRMLRWLAAHAAGRGLPLRAGQVVTTGSLHGMPLAEAGVAVTATLSGLGAVALRF
ncbi:fumarylacetoacetate hydrolase family protein [Roseomonas sp. CCTCC AB2023176]|uniref:fumarylacetoacetate hydrolase family protein n=1 Tax=Roseomonas sp. CCTCC AB2023176 TaxID=3342640 RepID=UPI0035DE899F